MRHFINLVEAPLADIEVYGKPDSQPESFSASDLKIIRRNIIEKKVFYV